MRTPHDLVTEWHKVFNVPIGNTPKPLTPQREALRVRLIEEEYNEFLKAIHEGDFIEQIDALGDLVYVIYGCAIEMGVNLDNVVDEIHNSNLSKLDENSDPIYRDDGKVLKGPLYFPPDLRRVIYE